MRQFGLYPSWAQDACGGLPLVREDRGGRSAGVPVVVPTAVPGSQDRNGEALTASKRETGPKMRRPTSLVRVRPQRDQLVDRRRVDTRQRVQLSRPNGRGLGPCPAPRCAGATRDVSPVQDRAGGRAGDAGRTPAGSGAVCMRRRRSGCHREPSRGTGGRRCRRPRPSRAIFRRQLAGVSSASALSAGTGGTGGRAGWSGGGRPARRGMEQR